MEGELVNYALEDHLRGASTLRANSHGSQVPLVLASPNLEAKSQLLSLKKPLKYG